MPSLRCLLCRDALFPLRAGASCPILPRMTGLTFLLALLCAYLCGSIPFGLLLTKHAGLGDIRTIGSGNIGATNVLRTGNKKIAALTLLCDALKGTVGVVAVWLLFAPRVNDSVALVSLAAVVALCGHIFPVWLKFKGGKGVATYIGVVLGLNPWLALLACATWLATAFLSRISSLSALVMVIVVLAAGLYATPPFAPALAFMSMLVVFRHKDNIVRLMNRTEPKIGKK